VNASLISGLSAPISVTCDGNGHLYVANFGSGTIGEYTTSGAVINASLISGLNRPRFIQLDGNGDLFVVSDDINNSYNGTIGEYSTSGATINASLITGLPGLNGIVIAPEPASWSLAALALTSLLLCYRKKRKSSFADN
jgi:hypothetical protein